MKTPLFEWQGKKQTLSKISKDTGITYKILYQKLIRGICKNMNDVIRELEKTAPKRDAV